MFDSILLPSYVTEDLWLQLESSQHYRTCDLGEEQLSVLKVGDNEGPFLRC